MSQHHQEHPSPTKVALELYAKHSPEVQASLDKLRNQFGKYGVPVHELRAALEQELGERTLSGELYKMRQGK